MTRAPLTPILLRSASKGAQDFRLAPVLYSFRLEVDYAVTPEDIFLGSVSAHTPTLGFLARLRLWLKLLFVGSGESVLEPARESAPQPQKTYRDVSRNRRGRRVENRALPIARSTYALGHILLRRWGYKRFVQWLNNYTLISRVRRCFRAPKRGSRARALSCAITSNLAPAFCAAPLRPD